MSRENPKLNVRFFGLFSIQAEGLRAIRVAIIPITVVSITLAALLLIAAARAGPESLGELIKPVSRIVTRP